MDQDPGKILETLSGSGELRKAGRHLTKVFYHLKVRQPVPVAEPVQAGSPLLDIRGEVTISQDEPMQAQVRLGMDTSDPLTLHLADGRLLDVRASRSDPLTGAYQITGDSVTGFRAH